MTFADTPTTHEEQEQFKTEVLDIAKFRQELARLSAELDAEKTKRETVETRNLKLTEEVRQERTSRLKAQAEAEVLMEVIEKIVDKLGDR